MPRFLSLLLLSLTLLTAACKKEESKPKPSIEGRWTLKELVDYEYDAEGKLLTQKSDSSPAALYFYTVISKDSILFYDVKDNSPLGGDKLTYLSSDTFTYSSVTVVVKELTDHKLVLRYPSRNRTAGRPYHEFEDVYSR
ncbi:MULTISPECIES: hypothetical protein [Hymenobacter]|uniref:Lipocalin-like domain-containing protein n=1 Tax=Hymenobacter mucosus TaxID=1411120 RepID=A0A238V246_9BACT|nr:MULTISPECIES: hypothetical protein [Hymenobacter]SNR28622.1 hypothetical protein SAMN06269173_10125 [Hymenobacter mucosus]